MSDHDYREHLDTLHDPVFDQPVTHNREHHRAEGAQRDARHERDHGCHVTADEARRRAQVRREAGRPDDATYWDEYAAEVDSWAEPRTFVYLVEGEPHTGTLDDYRRAYEVARHSGMSISTRLWGLVVKSDGLTGVPFPALECHDVEIDASESESDGYRRLTFRCLDQVAHGRIDLRA